MKLTDEQILENRKKVVAYLQQPHLKKAKGRLANEKTGGRCCLGHMCDALEIESSTINDGRERVYGHFKEACVAPIELKKALGLRNRVGSALVRKAANKTTVRTKLKTRTKRTVNDLTALNDHTGITTQGIGQYLESVIMGGDDTPWEKITGE